MSRGFMYILACADGRYYTGSTKDMDRRLAQHQSGEGANFTKKRLPVNLVYCEEFGRIDDAFYREKQVQGWSRKKKEALIQSRWGVLKEHSECMNDSHSRGFDSAQPPQETTPPQPPQETTPPQPHQETTPPQQLALSRTLIGVEGKGDKGGQEGRPLSGVEGSGNRQDQDQGD